MLDTKKLLYILPDVAYVAEVLPTKKEHTFAVHSFRQINGQFLDDDNLIAENVEKLFSKLEAENYHLILPDFLFTNTIVEVKETQESKVKTYIKDKLLPELEISRDTHEVETFTLTQYGNVSKVQLTALERVAIDSIVVSSKAHNIEISGVSPLSWTIKSIVSLEPSITIVQIGSILYLAEHYIGVDQCINIKVEEIENAVETIKTLKGAQPSIQTIYLLTNELVEQKLKEQISSTLPLQQLASFKEDDSQMPSYVKQIIESGMKTLDISDYPVPKFALPKQPTGLPAVQTESADADVDEKETAKPEPKEEAKEEKELTPPEAPENVKETSVGELKTEAVEAPLVLPVVTPPIALPQPGETALPAAIEETAIALPAQLDHSVESLDEPKTDMIAPPEESKPVEEKAVEAKTIDPEEKAVEQPPVPKVETEDSLPLTQFAPIGAAVTTTASSTPTETKVSSSPDGEPPRIIKNKSSATPMLRMIFITLAVFCATVAIGVGIGLGVLSLTNKNQDQVQSPIPSPSPVPQGSASPVPSPSPTSTASASASTKAQMSILVVNATTKAGYAGSTKSKLEKAGYKTVKATNAKGEYEPGFYVLMKTQDAALVTQLAEETGLKLEFAEGYATEDPKGEYSAVIVLAE